MKKIVLLLTFASSLSYANCRFMMKCIDSSASCTDLKLSIEGKNIIAKIEASAPGKDIFMCQDSFGNYYERLFPSTVTSGLLISKAHQAENPTSIDDIDPILINELENEAAISCALLAQEIDLETTPCP